MKYKTPSLRCVKLDFNDIIINSEFCPGGDTCTPADIKNDMIIKDQLDMNPYDDTPTKIN